MILLPGMVKLAGRLVRERYLDHNQTFEIFFSNRFIPFDTAVTLTTALLREQ